MALFFMRFSASSLFSVSSVIWLSFPLFTAFENEKLNNRVGRTFQILLSEGYHDTKLTTYRKSFVHSIQLINEPLSHETSRRIRNLNQRGSVEVNTPRTLISAVDQNINFWSLLESFRCESGTPHSTFIIVGQCFYETEPVRRETPSVYYYDR